MATTVAGVSLTTPKIFAKASEPTKAIKFSVLNNPWNRFKNGRICLRTVYATPENLTEKVEESIKAAQETCAEDPAAGECVAAWDEVEELSAARSHAKDKLKETDALETYCKDNPETDECRTYDN